MTPKTKLSTTASVASVVTFLLYTLVWDVGLLVAGAYLVFWKDVSGWVFVVVLYLCFSSYKPKHWRQLWSTENDEDKKDTP